MKLCWATPEHGWQGIEAVGRIDFGPGIGDKPACQECMDTIATPEQRAAKRAASRAEMDAYLAGFDQRQERRAEAASQGLSVTFLPPQLPHRTLPQGEVHARPTGLARAVRRGH